jgi:hypothetical protein
VLSRVRGSDLKNRKREKYGTCMNLAVCFPAAQPTPPQPSILKQ